jgi:uncharacterized repeat protein (TIGR03847 family)
MSKPERYEFNEVTILSAFAVGVPGKRTFFLGIGKPNNWLRIWLEKEHLQALVVAIEQLFFTLSQEKIDLPEEGKTPSLSEDIASILPSAELDIAQITLGYDQGSATIELLVQRSGSQEEDLSEVDLRVTLVQLKEFGSQVTRVCAAGRPLCPICGDPIDPSGHVCPKQN